MQDKPTTRWNPRRFSSVMGNLDAHLVTEKRIATEEAAQLDDKVFHNWFNTYEGKQKSSNIR